MQAYTGEAFIYKWRKGITPSRQMIGEQIARYHARIYGQGDRHLSRRPTSVLRTRSTNGVPFGFNSRARWIASR